MDKKIKFLHTPPGSKPFYKEEALFRNLIEKKLSSFFEKWSFFPIETPIIDYFDVYSDILSDDIKKGSVKFVDRDGEIILLRNDITLFAAKLVAGRVSNDKSTLKYYYSDSIIRKEKSGNPEEYYQIGCEIVGNDFTYQEIEIFSLLLESLNELEIKDTTLHIGDISFYQNLLDDLPKEDLEEILNCIRLHDKRSLTELLDKLVIDDGIKKDCLVASKFIGNLSDLQKLDFSKKGKDAILRFENIIKILSTLGYGDKIVIDLSELPTLNYYNGLIFHLYSDKVETPIVSGGRYDILFEKLGLNKSAVGFSFWLYPLEKLLSKNYLKKESVLDISLKDNVVEDFKKAIEMVKNNKKINISY
ncbi:MAG TPA: ATP phosphoribosyltransferase regulatory subunit [Spirochaetota bacterium]|nr:ATP phosphoribosyltransferase regulatory subunit [Spirochaetota bacterium]